jgi:hypothetical protein
MMKRILKAIGVIVFLAYFIGNVLPNLIGVPLAAYHSYKARQTAEDFINEDYQPKVSSTNESYFKNSIWIHDQDSLAKIEIKNGKWIMSYKGLKTNSSDVYEYRVTKEYSIPQNTQANSTELLTLISISDTLRYEILRYDEDYLNLMYLPRGNILLYKAYK